MHGHMDGPMNVHDSKRNEEMPQVTENQSLLPAEDRFNKLRDCILATLSIFDASLVMKRERDEEGHDGMSLYAVFDSDPDKPMLMMRACNGFARMSGWSIASSAYAPERTIVEG